MALVEQRRERQRLAGGPIEPNASIDRLGSVFQEPLHGAVNPDAIGHLGDLAADILQFGDSDPGDAAARILLLVGRT